MYYIPGCCRSSRHNSATLRQVLVAVRKTYRRHLCIPCFISTMLFLYISQSWVFVAHTSKSNFVSWTGGRFGPKLAPVIGPNFTPPPVRGRFGPTWRAKFSSFLGIRAVLALKNRPFLHRKSLLEGDTTPYYTSKKSIHEMWTINQVLPSWNMSIHLFNNFKNIYIWWILWLAIQNHYSTKIS